MKQYVVKRFWGVEEIVVEAKNEEHAKEWQTTIPILVSRP